MRRDDPRPAIVVESFSQTRDRAFRRPLTPHAGSLALRPPGADLAARVASVFAVLKQDYDRTIGTHRDIRPRTHSHVEHRVGVRAADAIAVLQRAPELNVSASEVRLTVVTPNASYDPVQHEYRLRASLRLRWSWPALPMWLTVAEVSSTRGAVRLSLRSRTRLRYPLRYFHAAHSVLTRLESLLESNAA